MPATLATAAAPAALQGPGLLAEITAGLSQGSDIDALLQRFLEPILRLARARAGAVRVIDGDGQLQLVGSIGLPASWCGAEQRVDRHCGSCGRAMDGDQPAWSDALGDCDQATRAMLSPMGVQHMLAVPLAHRDRLLGVYNLFFDTPQWPGAEVRTVLRSVGELLGLALANARLEAENLQAVVMQERQLMAAEVHDAVAQDLAFLRMRLPLLEQAIGQHDDARATQYVSDLRQALGRAHGSLRHIITEFRTPADPRGLAHALRERVDEFTRRSGIPAELDNQAPELALPPTLEAQVLHIIGEALANIGHHAAARQAWMSLRRLDTGLVEACIADDGVGLAAATGHTPGHHGLSIMAERARRIGGQLLVQPRAGGGTLVRLSFPMQGGAR